MKISRTFVVALGSLLGVTISSVSAHALDCRNLEAIVVWGAGGGTDVFMRELATPLSNVLGIPVKVLNITGAAGENGRQELVGRPADGCTVINVEPDTMTTEILGQTKLSLMKDLVPVFRAHVDIGVLHSRAGEFENWDELVAWAKANPGELNMGGVGTVGSDRGGIEITLKAAGVEDFNYIPYDSTSTMFADLLGGRLHGMYDEMGSVGGMVDAGQITPLIVISEERLALLPEVPAAGELGYPIAMSNWRGLAVKADTPPETIAELSAAMMEASMTDEYRAYESERALDLVENGRLDHKAFKELVEKEYADMKERLAPQ